MDWKKVEIPLKDGWLNVSYQSVPDHIPKEQYAKYVKKKNKDLEKYGGLTIEQYGYLLKNGEDHDTETNM